MRGNKHQTLFLALLLCLVGLLGAQTFDAPLILDDEDELKHVQGFSNLWQCFGPDSYGLLRPVKNLLFWAVSRVTVSPVLAAHITSTLLFIAATGMVCLWFRLWYPGSRWPLIGAAIWSLSPTLVSTQAWFSCSNILVYTISLLGGLCLWETAHRSVTSGLRRRTVGLLFCCSLCYLVAFFSYEGAIVLPLLALLQDLARRRNLVSRTSVVFYGTLVLLVLATLLTKWALASSIRPVNPGFGPISGSQLEFASAYFLIAHLLWWAVPFGRQEILGTFVPGASATQMQLVASWLIVGLGLGFSAAVRDRSPRVALGCLWTMVAFVPMSNLIPLRTGPFADYYLTLSSVGTTLVVLETLRWALRDSDEMNPRPLPIRSALWMLVIAIGLWRGSAVLTSFQWATTWNDPAALFRASLGARTHAYRAGANLARYCMMNGDLAQAERLAHVSQAEAPWYSLSYNVLGDVKNRSGDHQAARDWYMNALTNSAADAYTHFALAFTCETWLNDVPTARQHYGIVTAEGASNPFRQQAFLNFGRLLGVSGDPDGAMILLRRALVEFPASADLRHNLSVACNQSERSSDAFAHEKDKRNAPHESQASSKAEHELGVTAQRKSPYTGIRADK